MVYLVRVVVVMERRRCVSTHTVPTCGSRVLYGVTNSASPGRPGASLKACWQQYEDVVVVVVDVFLMCHQVNS